MKIGVVGAGLMGAEIAFTFAYAGHSVLLNDRSEEALQSALARLNRLYDKGADRGFYQASDKDTVFARIEMTEDRESFSSCDFITEAVFEREDVKADVFRELDRICRPSACNYSSILNSCYAWPLFFRFYAKIIFKGAAACPELFFLNVDTCLDERSFIAVNGITQGIVGDKRACGKMDA